MRLITFLLFAFAMIVLVLSGMLAYQTYVLNSKEFKPYEYRAEDKEIYENISQFYPNMRYPESRISYSISEKCDADKVKNIQETLNILSQKTSLRFYQKSNGSEIEYLCSELAPEAERKNYYVAGEGGPKEIIDSGLFHVILSGKVSLYRDEKCDEPKVAIHETLHALGFDHNNNPKSILYPVTSCDEQIDDYIIKEINDIYSIPSLPDLAITRISVERHSRYISFEMDILNQGLKKTGPIYLEVYADDELIKTFDIEDLNIGYKKIITVQNLKVPYSSKTVNFKTGLKDDASEIDLLNNEASIEMIEE